MSKNRVLWCALLGSALILIGFQPALAQNGAGDIPPQEIAKRCMIKVTEEADACVKFNRKTAERTVGKIEELLEAGNEEKARKVGKQAVKKVNTRTQNCVKLIHKVCKRSVKAIIEAGGSQELVDRVKEACKKQVERVNRSRREAIRAIHEALGIEPLPPPPPPPEGEEE